MQTSGLAVSALNIVRWKTKVVLHHPSSSCQRYRTLKRCSAVYFVAQKMRTSRMAFCTILHRGFFGMIMI